MNRQLSPTIDVERPDVRHWSEIHLHGGFLFIARVGWLCLAGLCVLVFALSIPVSFTQLEHVCNFATCGAPYLSRQDVPELAKMGLSITFFATYFTVAAMLFALVWVVIGSLIFWRKSNEPRALLFALFLVSFGTIFTADPTTTLAAVHPALWWFAAAIDSLNLTYFLLFLYLFPAGHFAPRWMVWLLLAELLFQIAGHFFPNSALNTSNGGAVTGAFFLISIMSVVFSLIYRYRRHSTPVERQQTKWVLFAIVLALVLYAPASIFGPTDALLSQFVGSTVLYVALSLIPIAIAISILRYRLWDIDNLINKALVYGLLTALLAAFYAGLVIVLQAFLSGLLHQTNAVAIVVSTLAIVALFRPLRCRIQNLIDRRFYRRKYDAAKTLAAFSATLHSELDLEQLREQLLAVVEETMQPTHVSLWLKQDQWYKKTQAPREGGQR
ncbi:MAG TPA: hypothetical protein VKR83_15930 [Ktedonobacteraceae bacterium]|nr:hypothetical protein [Ktedonobacteraceae bacterium]